MRGRMAKRRRDEERGVEELDVLIVGAGISGIGCAYYLQRDHPGKSYAILEARAATGGTWDLFRYPGIRSDSDLHTFGFEFKPWESDHAIAEGAEILRYIREAASENGIDPQIRLHHRVISAAWSSETGRWLVEVVRTDTSRRFQISARWLFAGTGYYRYDSGYTPELPGIGNYRGRVVHPQHWPRQLDYAGKQVVVIGSGATAVTLIPAIAKHAGHVTMLQRSPSYILPVPSKDGLANLLRRVFGPGLGYDLARRKNIFQQTMVYRLCQRYPKQARAAVRWLNSKQLPEGYPVDQHFHPNYDPWDQRLCIVPDGDLFHTIASGDASVVTDTIDTFTTNGIRLASGQELEADIVITATGLRLLAFGGIELTVDGRKARLPEHLAFRGMMLSDVPNFAYLVGYTNASWTLKVGLVGEHLSRILRYMDQHGLDICVPELPYPNMTTRPLLDFSAGYVLRSLEDFPKQGAYAPWRLPMDFKTDRRVLIEGPVEDRNLRFSTLAQPAARTSVTTPPAGGPLEAETPAVEAAA
jgi:cation diffusion facilitator CzcD-associated flavoprotein CzcO